MIDRLVNHAEVVSLKGDSYPAKGQRHMGVCLTTTLRDLVPGRGKNGLVLRGGATMGSA